MFFKMRIAMKSKNESAKTGSQKRGFKMIQVAEEGGGDSAGAGRPLGSKNKKRSAGDHPGWGGRRQGAGKKPKALTQAAALARIVPKTLTDGGTPSGSP